MYKGYVNDPGGGIMLIYIGKFTSMTVSCSTNRGGNRLRLDHCVFCRSKTCRGFYISYFSISIIGKHDIKLLIKGRVYYSLQFKWDKSPSCWDWVMVDGRSRKLSSHLQTQAGSIESELQIARFKLKFHLQ